MRIIVALLALAGLGSLHLAQAIQYTHDELLYTKQLWDEFKLDFPYSVFQEDDVAVSQAKETVTGLFVEHSLDGPQKNLKELIKQDLERGKLQPDSFDVALIDENAIIAGAVGVAQCKSCLVLASVLWDSLLEWTHRYMHTITASDLYTLGDELCEYEVPVKVLQEWVVLSARVRGAAEGQAAQQFYMLSVRHRQHARPQEIRVVRDACRALLSNKHETAVKIGRMGPVDDLKDAKPSALLVAAAARQAEYLTALQEKGGKPAEKAPSVAEDGSEGPPAPRAQRTCINKHPQCEYWAEKGECKANPGYMVGSATSGWCRAACLSCAPPKRIAPAGLTEEDAKALRAISQSLLDRLQTAGCTRASACRWVEGNDAKSVLAAAAGVDPARTAALKQVSIVSGPIDEDAIKAEQAAATGVDPRLLQDSVILTMIPADKAVANTRTPDEIESAAEVRSEAKTGPNKDAGAAERALWTDLGGRCMYTNTGWWSYEHCYMQNVTQLHVNPGASAPDWVISLGHFEFAEWDIVNASDAVLFSPGSKVPYVLHELDMGSECQLNGEPGVNSLARPEADPNASTNKESTAATSTSSTTQSIGDTVRRSSVVRYMCSPDGKIHMVITEPEQCRYVVDVYVPSLCGVKGMAPVRAKGDYPVVPMTVASTSSTMGSTTSTSTDGSGTAVHDDDPYLDPDDIIDEDKGTGRKDEL